MSERLRRVADLAGAMVEDLANNSLTRTRADEVLTLVVEEILEREGAREPLCPVCPPLLGGHRPWCPNRP